MAHNITLKKVKQILGRESQQNLINHFQNFHKKTVNPDTKIQNTQKRLIGRRLQKKIGHRRRTNTNTNYATTVMSNI